MDAKIFSRLVQVKFKELSLSSSKFRTFPLAAGSYKSNQALNDRKTHLCEIDSGGSPIKVMCNRVKIDSILDDSTQGTTKEPTCSNCASIYSNLK